MQECSHFVLSTIIDFIYGISLPEELGLEDLCSLLAMADLFLMEGLKRTVAPLLGKQLTADNILKTSQLAAKHSDLKLQELCCNFILDNIDSLSTILLDDLFTAMPAIGRASLLKCKMQNIANKFPGVELQIGFFKERADFSSEEEYEKYVRANIKPNMVVLLGPSGTSSKAFGQVLDVFDDDAVMVKQEDGSTCTMGCGWVELLT